MKIARNKILLIIGFLGLVVVGAIALVRNKASLNDNMLSYVVSTKSHDLRFYWRDDSARIFRSIANLQTWLNSNYKTLVFATNGGMFKPDNSPQGLFIQEYTTLTPLDTSSGNGNFYLKPNGVFYVTHENSAVICRTEEFSANSRIRFATQSGPMLVIHGEIHPSFTQGSSNVHIRSGVGILPDNNVVFAMSKEKINLYDFATYFKELGCKNALYLDGFVSRIYLPEKQWMQTDGDFGVIIGVTIPQQ